MYRSVKIKTKFLIIERLCLRSQPRFTEWNNWKKVSFYATWTDSMLCFGFSSISFSNTISKRRIYLVKNFITLVKMESITVTPNQAKWEFQLRRLLILNLKSALNNSDTFTWFVFCTFNNTNQKGHYSHVEYQRELVSHLKIIIDYEIEFLEMLLLTCAYIHFHIYPMKIANKYLRNRRAWK